MCTRTQARILDRCNEDYRHTNRFQVFSFVGVFIQEEMISGSVFWNAAGQVTCFCRVGVDQLDRLLHHVQPLKSNMAERVLEPVEEGAVLWFHTHQLDVVDALAGELLQRSLGALLQGEGEALQRLVLALHADLGVHLQGAAKPRKIMTGLQSKIKAV